MITQIWQTFERWERWFLPLLILVSLGLRLGYEAEMSGTLFLTQLRLDELFHNNWAASIASGNVLGDQIFFRAPLYAYWLGLNFALFGHSYFIPRIIQHLLGTISVLMVYFLARKLFGKKVAAISSLLMSTYAAMIYHEDKFLLESILIPQVIFFALALYAIKDKPTLLKWSGLGVLFGLLCITRPTFLPLLVILALTVVIWYRKTYPLKKYYSWIGGLVLGTFLIIAPVTLRNYFIGNEFVPIASQGGINFYLGNNSSADGFSSTMPGAIGNRWEDRDIRYPVQQLLRRQPSTSEIDSYWKDQAFKFIVKQPAEFLFLTLKKLYLFWNNIEIPNNNSFYLYEQFSIILKWLPTGFWIVGPLGLLGIWIALREKRGRLLVCFIIFYTSTIIIFFVCDRFRIPIVPFLSIFAGLSVMRLWEVFREHSKTQFKKYVAVLLLCGIAVNSNIYNFQKGNRSSDLFQLGNMELSAGNYAKAISYYQQLTNTKTIIREAHLNYGVAELRSNNIDNALEQFRSELKNFPASYDALSNLAHLYYIEGRPDLSLYYARQAIEVKPYAPMAYIDMAFALSDLQRYNAAESTLTNFINLHGKDALYEESVLAGIHLVQGKLDLAEMEYRSILSRVKPQVQPGYEPEFQYSKEYSIGGNWEEFKAKVYYSLGHIFLQRERYDSAYVYFKRATTSFPTFSDAWISIGNTMVEMDRFQEADSAFSISLKLNPNNFMGWYNYGLLMEKMNRPKDAEQALRTSLQCNPDFEEAKTELKAIQQRK